jgi:GT2 family glycosyltransferase
LATATHRQSKLLQIITELPSLQDQIAPHTVSNCPVEDLIVERIFERVFEITPRASVLISVQHEWLTGTLRGLMKQTLPFDDFEVIVVDAGESANFASAVNEVVANPECDMQLLALRAVQGGRARAHNVALRLARGQVVVFLADDFVPPETFLEAHLKFHDTNSDGAQVAVGAGVFPSSLRNIKFRCWLEDTGLLYGVSYTEFPTRLPQDFFYTANSSMKKELIKKTGFFDEDFSDDALDDYEMGRRLAKIGAHSVFVRGVECSHVHPQTLRERCAIMKLAGIAACVFDCKYPGVKGWHIDLALTPAQHRAKAVLGMGAYLLSGDRTLQHRYWKKLLAANFVEGYLSKLRTLVEL